MWTYFQLNNLVRSQQHGWSRIYLMGQKSTGVHVAQEVWMSRKMHLVALWTVSSVSRTMVVKWMWLPLHFFYIYLFFFVFVARFYMIFFSVEFWEKRDFMEFVLLEFGAFCKHVRWRSQGRETVLKESTLTAGAHFKICHLVTHTSGRQHHLAGDPSGAWADAGSIVFMDVINEAQADTYGCCLVACPQRTWITKGRVGSLSPRTPEGSATLIMFA